MCDPSASVKPSSHNPTPPWWTQLSTLSFPIISALCYFPVLCKWHWLADVNSHSTEEMSQSFCVPNSDGSSITKAANTHYTPITDHHSNNCNSTQSCRKVPSRDLHSTSAISLLYTLFLEAAEWESKMLHWDLSTLKKTSAYVMWIFIVPHVNKDVINMLHITKNIHESGTGRKCVYADKFSGVNLQSCFPAAFFKPLCGFLFNFFPLWRSEGKQVQFKLSGLKYRERK